MQQSKQNAVPDNAVCDILLLHRLAVYDNCYDNIPGHHGILECVLGLQQVSSFEEVGVEGEGIPWMVWNGGLQLLDALNQSY